MSSQRNPQPGDGDGSVKAPNRRLIRKQQTRDRVLAAARRLLSVAGYEGATIRDIAAEAGMSTGAIFVNFKDKSQLFREIIFADMAALTASMRDAADGGRGVEDALLRAFSTGYAFYKSQLPLARAAFCVSWLPDEGVELRFSTAAKALRELITEQVQFAVERGELSQEAEVKLRGDMLFDAYLANYPEAIFLGWSLEALQAKARDQIRVILAGARRG